MTTAKRLLDITVAGSALIAAAPVLVLVAVAVKLDSPGPALFVQGRVGKSRRPIRTLKFRTMIDRPASGPSITAGDDPRITRVGRWLRRTKLDELPQLWNVVRGDMSLVGPRPEVPRYVEQYRSEWLRLFDVRPGITDLASLAFRDEEQLLAIADDPDRAYREVIMPLKLALALEGVERSSILEDLRIIAHTLSAIVGIHDARTERLVAQAERRIIELNSMPHTS